MPDIAHGTLTADGIAQLPSGPGSYVLVLWLPDACHLAVGRRLEADLERGYYLYVGSALGGLRGRVRRYLGATRQLHWHVDYLLQVAMLTEVWYRESAARLECIWAARLGRCDCLSPAVRRFGSSDCRCLTHLYHAAERPCATLLADSTVRVLRIAADDQHRT